jgi:hypothetical protein
MVTFDCNRNPDVYGTVAGKSGVFATRTFRKGDVIATYDGKHRAGKTRLVRYKLPLANGWLDAMALRKRIASTGFVFGAGGTARISPTGNCHIYFCGETAVLVAVKTIEPGSEILIRNYQGQTSNNNTTNNNSNNNIPKNNIDHTRSYTKPSPFDMAYVVRNVGINQYDEAASAVSPRRRANSRTISPTKMSAVASTNRASRSSGGSGRSVAASAFSVGGNSIRGGGGRSGAASVSKVGGASTSRGGGGSVAASAFSVGAASTSRGGGGRSGAASVSKVGGNSIRGGGGRSGAASVSKVGGNSIRGGGGRSGAASVLKVGGNSTRGGGGRSVAANVSAVGGKGSRSVQFAVPSSSSMSNGSVV